MPPNEVYISFLLVGLETAGKGHLVVDGDLNQDRKVILVVVKGLLLSEILLKGVTMQVIGTGVAIESRRKGLLQEVQV